MNKNLIRALAHAAVAGEQSVKTEAGLVLPKTGIQISGEYIHRVNGGEWQVDKNLITAEGITHILNTAMGTKAKPTAYYLALYSGAVAPADNWSASNFPTVASEIVSATEGYTSAKRPLWKPKESTTNVIDNFEAYASVTIATTASLNVTGSALLTSDVKGGTSGVLIGATKYASQRTFQDGDVFDIGYRITLTV